MVDFLTLGFLRRSRRAGALRGGLGAGLGFFVVRGGRAFMGAGTARGAFAGVALASLVGGPPMPFAIAFGLGTAWITGLLEEQGRMKLDVSIGIFYTATMALAILFIGLMKTYNAEVYGYLFGSILSVTAEELKLTAGLATVVVGLLALFAKEFFFLAFDQEMAEASGVPARRFFFLLLNLVALTIVVSPKTVGAILVFALLLIPAATSYQLTSSLHRVMAYSGTIGGLVSLAGVLLSFQSDLPTGPAIVLLATGVFFVAVAFSPKRTPKPALS